MAGDISHNFGQDLSFGPTGDLAFAPDTLATRQRVLRRLLTNSGDYIQHPSYGAGLGKFVGQPAPATRIRAIVRQQMKLEHGVAPVPQPTADVRSDTSGNLTLHVTYADKPTGQTVTATGPLGN